jgi:predicted nuclease of predicted toxin-antitoxin system
VNGRHRPLVVLLDEGTPVPAAKPFLQRRHSVIFHYQVLESGATDHEVVAAAILNEAVLVAVEADMRRMVRRFGTPGRNERYAKLSLIHIRCNEVMAAKRLDQAMSFIEHEWKFACEKAARRMWVDIEPHKLASYR